MFIRVVHRDVAELSVRKSMDVDESTEKVLLVNPNCPVRIMLEYIRKKCKLGPYTNFDLCDESGGLKGLFDLPTYYYAHEMFNHKKTYYVIVMKQEVDRKASVTVLPQLNHENKLYTELKSKVKRYLITGEVTPPVLLTKGSTPPKITPPKTPNKK